MIDFFHPDEFRCGCGCGKGFVDMDTEFLDRLNVARFHAGRPFSLSSAYRCRPHNEAVGGAENSAHLRGMAVDIRAWDDEIRFWILDGLRRAGFNRFGIYPTWIHVDSDSSKLPNRTWYGG